MAQIFATHNEDISLTHHVYKIKNVIVHTSVPVESVLKQDVYERAYDVVDNVCLDIPANLRSTYELLLQDFQGDSLQLRNVL